MRVFTIGSDTKTSFKSAASHYILFRTRTMRDGRHGALLARAEPGRYLDYHLSNVSCNAAHARGARSWGQRCSQIWTQQSFDGGSLRRGLSSQKGGLNALTRTIYMLLSTEMGPKLQTLMKEVRTSASKRTSLPLCHACDAGTTN